MARSAAASPPFNTHLANLKWQSVILMTACHILLTRHSTIGLGLFVGATVFPIFGGMIVVHLAAQPDRRLSRYLTSLGIAAVAAELPYLLLNREGLAWPWQVPLNVLATFFCGVVLCGLYHRRRFLLLGLALIPVILLGRIGLGGSYPAPIAMLIAFIGARHWQWGPFIAFALVSLALAINDVETIASIPARWHCAGLAMLPLAYALGRIPLTPPRMPRLFFYAYYPGHLMLIWLIWGAFPFYDTSSWLTDLAAKAARDHKGENPSLALRQEATTQANGQLAAASGAAKSRVAAEQFMGFYLINVRSRTDYCRRQGVDITAWTQAFSRIEAQDYAESRMILARGPEDADAFERQMVQQLSANSDKIIDDAMAQAASQAHVSTVKFCEAFAAKAEAVAENMRLSKTLPALSKALAEAR